MKEKTNSHVAEEKQESKRPYEDTMQVEATPVIDKASSTCHVIHNGQGENFVKDGVLYGCPLTHDSHGEEGKHAAGILNDGVEPVTHLEELIDTVDRYYGIPYGEVWIRRTCRAILKDDQENSKLGDAERYFLMLSNIRKVLK